MTHARLVAVAIALIGGLLAMAPAAAFADETCRTCHTTGGLAGEPPHHSLLDPGTNELYACSYCHAASSETGNCIGCHSASQKHHLSELWEPSGHCDYCHSPGGTDAGCENCHVAPSTGVSGTFSLHHTPSTDCSRCHDPGGCASCHEIPTTATTGHHDIAVLAADLCTRCHTTDPTPTGGCTSCHSGTGEAHANAECLGCHKEAMYSRRPIGPEFALTSHHVDVPEGGQVAKEQCKACHDLSAHMGGQVLLKDANGGASIPYSDRASATPFCLSCHDEDSAASLPFSNGNTPTAFAWDGKAVAPKYTAVQVVDSNKYPPNQLAPGAESEGWHYNTVPNEKKALSAHGNPAANQPNGSQLDVPVPCLGCHNSHGSPVERLLYSDAGYSPSSIEDFCWDCHLNDEGSPLRASEYLAGDRVRDYYGDDRWGMNDGAGFKSDWMGTFAYKDGPFKSSHFYPSKGKMSDEVWTRSEITCTDCHDVHGVDPSQAESQYMVPLLKGTWLISPYKEDRAPMASFASSMVDMGYYGGDERLPRHVPQGGAKPRANPDLDHNNPPDPGGGYFNNTGGSGHEGYFIDGNTFGVINTSRGRPGRTGDWGRGYTLRANSIGESDAQFAGLCLRCHPRQAVEAAWSGHGTVKGWSGAQRDLFPSRLAQGEEEADGGYGVHNMGMYDESDGNYARGYRWDVDPMRQDSRGYIQTTYHQFPCSKCHTPHAAPLARLMVTNCLDTAGGHAPYPNSQWRYATNCHSTSRNLAWNEVTPWQSAGGEEPMPPGVGGLEMGRFSPSSLSVRRYVYAWVDYSVFNDTTHWVERYEAEFDKSGSLRIRNVTGSPSLREWDVSSDRFRFRWENVPPGTPMEVRFEVTVSNTGGYQLTPRSIGYELSNGERRSGGSGCLVVTGTY